MTTQFREAYAQPRGPVPNLGDAIERDLTRGLIFQDGKLGECLMRRNGEQVWLHARHPDGQFVSVRAMNKDEVGLVVTIGRSACTLWEEGAPHQ